MTRLLRLAAVAAALLACSAGAPAAAAAATVTVSFAFSQQYPTEHGPPPLAASLAFIASSGESNDVSVTGVPSGYRIHDAGAPVSGDPAYCSSSDLHTLTCAVPFTGAHDSGFAAATFDLGDGNDIFRGIDLGTYSGSERTAFTIDGGPGDDQITAGLAKSVTLTGGPGNDVVTGGAADTIIGSPGQDLLDGQGGALDMSHTGTSVTVDLRRGTAAAAGESDALRNFTAVSGGGHRDTLIGGPGPATILDSTGRSTLIGGDGPTLLGGSAGGNRITCAYAANRAIDVTARDLITGRCRAIDPAAEDGEFVPRLPLRPRSATVATLNYLCVTPPCALTLQLRVARGAPVHQNAPPGQLLGLKRIVMRRQRAVAPVRLSPFGVRLLARDRSLRVTVSYLEHDETGPSSGAYTTILRFG